MTRVRFAPSPTGYLHIGGARTALFNYLHIKKNNGKLILRIEDTDIARSDCKMSEQIIHSLSMLGIKWDEGPFYQSSRLDFYRKYAEQLVADGKAYYCYCSAEELKNRAVGKNDWKYDRKCLKNAEEKNSCERIIRFKVPENKVITVDDLILGTVEFNTEIIEDFVLLKSDGIPTYHLAVVVDDALMGIELIMRGNDHLSNTPKQIMLYEALGKQVPKFAHLPLILGQDKKRLSKRHGAASVEAFLSDGIIPEALVNYIALLGWSPPDRREIMNIDEMIGKFEISAAGKNDAIFDYAKLEWINSQHIMMLSAEKIFDYITALNSDVLKGSEKKYVVRVIKLLQPRLKKLTEFESSSEYFFKDDFSIDAAAEKKYLQSEESKYYLKKIYEIYINADFSDEKKLEELLRAAAEELNIGAGKLIHPLRVSVSGRTATPGIFEVISTLGKEKTLKRLEKYFCISVR